MDRQSRKEEDVGLAQELHGGIARAHLALVAVSGVAALLQALEEGERPALQLERRLSYGAFNEFFALLQRLIRADVVVASGSTLLNADCRLTEAGRRLSALCQAWRQLDLPLAEVEAMVADHWSRALLQRLCVGAATAQTLATAFPGLRRSLLQERLHGLEAIDLVGRAPGVGSVATRPYVLKRAPEQVRAVLRLVAADDEQG